MEEIIVIGGGLAGSEASWQIANRGIKVVLYEMRPKKLTPAHKTGYLAELVCSNSLRSKELTKAVGLLKEELKFLDSIIMKAAETAQIEGGKSLIVDREKFSSYVTEKLENHPLIEIKREEVCEIPKDKIVVIAAGPLISECLTKSLLSFIDSSYLYLYDAISPIIYADSINWDKVFIQDRYFPNKPGIYVNCPLTKEEYLKFVEELLKAEKVEFRDFEQDISYFEGCLPIEVMAERGIDTLRYGPMKPKGLIDPRTGKEPYAVVQLRPENKEKTCYNMVGFQTKLKYNEQKRVFRLIPGLENAEFARFGSIHRNTFVNAPKVLTPFLHLKNYHNIFLGGQITGVEGYVESTATGFLAGINAVRLLKGQKLVTPPPETAMGALVKYITSADPRFFQPMNINWGLFPPINKKFSSKKEKWLYFAYRALEKIKEFKKIIT